jgi:hypothetical protein
MSGGMLLPGTLSSSVVVILKTCGGRKVFSLKMMSRDVKIRFVIGS